MQIFEFHFNPKAKEEAIFDSFIYEPENVYEKKLGSLYVAGELTNALPQDHLFLNNLASAIKEKYYQLSAQTSPEIAIKNSLKEANNFLGKQEEEGNISWLGNLNLAVISLKEFKLNFTKVGDIKVLLSRRKQITDISKELEDKQTEASPLKIFSNIVSGKLTPEDKIIVLTREVFNLFEKEEILNEVFSAFEKDLGPEAIGRELKKVLDKKKNILTEVSGIFLLVSLEATQKETIRVKEPVTLKRRLPLKLPLPLSFPKIKLKGKLNPLNLLKFIPLLNKEKVKNILTLPQRKIPKIIKKLPIPLPKKLSIPLLKKTEISIPKKLPSLKIPNLKVLLILIVFLIAILVSGGYIFKIQKQKEIERIQVVLTETQQLISEAENAFIFDDEKRANLLYQEAWRKVLPLSEEEGVPFRDEVSNLKESIEKELFPLNKIEKITDPQAIFELKSEEFSPQKMIISNSNLYLFNPQSDNIYNLKLDQKEGEIIQIPNKIKLSTKIGDSIILFSEPNQLFILEESIATKTLNFPYSNPVITALASFNRNFYLLDPQQGEIIKFKLGEESQLSGELWLDQEIRKPLEVKSMAIDGSIWTSSKDNSLLKYYKGEFQEELILEFFPSPEGISKIAVHQNFSYLYLLTPSQNRVIILDKTGQIIKQYRSDDFNDLKDFALSENGKTIYLLNGLKIYQIEL